MNKKSIVIWILLLLLSGRTTFGQTRQSFSLESNPENEGFIMTLRFEYYFFSYMGEARVSMASSVTSNRYKYQGRIYTSNEIMGTNTFDGAEPDVLTISAEVYDKSSSPARNLGRITLKNVISFTGGNNATSQDYDFIGQLGLDNKIYREKVNSLVLRNPILIKGSATSYNIKSKIQAMEKKSKYESTLREADNLFANKQYENSKQKYTEASRLDYTQNYPKTKIDEIDQIQNAANNKTNSTQNQSYNNQSYSNQQQENTNVNNTTNINQQRELEKQRQKEIQDQKDQAKQNEIDLALQALKQKQAYDTQRSEAIGTAVGTGVVLAFAIAQNIKAANARKAIEEAEEARLREIKRLEDEKIRIENERKRKIELTEKLAQREVLRKNNRNQILKNTNSTEKKYLRKIYDFAIDIAMSNNTLVTLSTYLHLDIERVGLQNYEIQNPVWKKIQLADEVHFTSTPKNVVLYNDDSLTYYKPNFAKEMVYKLEAGRESVMYYNTSNSNYITEYTENILIVFDIETKLKKNYYPSKADNGNILRIQFSPDRKYMAVIKRKRKKNAFSVIDLASEQEYQGMDIATYRNVVFGNTSRYVLCPNVENKLTLYDFRNELVAKELNITSTDFKFSPQDNYLCFYDKRSKNIMLTDLKSLQSRTSVVKSSIEINNFETVIFSPNQKFIIIGTDTRLLFYDIKQAKISFEMPILFSDLQKLKFSKDGKKLFLYNSKIDDEYIKEYDFNELLK